MSNTFPYITVSIAFNVLKLFFFKNNIGIAKDIIISKTIPITLLNTLTTVVMHNTGINIINSSLSNQYLPIIAKYINE